MTPAQAAECVAAGAKALDDKAGPGWWGPERINLAILDINHTRLCVLGQVFRTSADGRPGYDWAVANLFGGNWELMKTLGFLSPDDDEGVHWNTALLENAWWDLIVGRRAAASELEQLVQTVWAEV